MNKTDHRRTRQLGMSIGTASHRLKKQLMHRLAQRLGEDACFRCGKPILTAEELSIDHKKTWLDIDISLFWDLDNIAFSHRSCNKPDRPRGLTREVIAERNEKLRIAKETKAKDRETRRLVASERRRLANIGKFPYVKDEIRKTNLEENWKAKKKTKDQRRYERRKKLGLVVLKSEQVGYIRKKRSDIKLNDERVALIRTLYETGNHTMRSLAKQFGVSQPLIANVINLKIWKPRCESNEPG